MPSERAGSRAGNCGEYSEKLTRIRATGAYKNFQPGKAWWRAVRWAARRRPRGPTLEGVERNDPRGGRESGNAVRGTASGNASEGRPGDGHNNPSPA